MGYWENRQAQIMYEQMEDAEKVARELADIYAKATRELNYQIGEIFDRFEDKHNLTEDEARKLLGMMKDPADITTLREALYKDTQKAELLAEFESPAYRARMKRLVSLQTEIDRMMREIYGQEKSVTSEYYANVFHNSYYRNIYEIQRKAGFQFYFSAVDSHMLNQMLAMEWAGGNYSLRIWNNTNILAKELKEQLIIGYLTGKSESDIAAEIANKFAVTSFQARRLVRTESNFQATQGQKLAYEEADLEHYQIVAVLDLKTSERCRRMDEKIFPVAKMQSGENAPPFHPFCRTTTVAYFNDDDLANLKRRARNPLTGKNELVPADTTYAKWYEINVANNPEAQAIEKAIRNWGADQKQYVRYKQVLGKSAGKSLADFQEMKYNKPEEWEGIHTRYKDTKLKEKIRSDSTNKTIHSGKQGKHIPGHNNYKEGRSYLTITEQQAQELVNQYAGTGQIIRDRNGKYTGKERITTNDQIGVCIDLEGNEVPTKSFMIHYSKDGVHIVPAGGSK